MSVNSLIGQTIGGYRIDERLGSGGMGAVYKATQLRLGRSVALKVLSSELNDDPEFVNRFIQEGQAVASLEHPNIVPIYEADEVTLPNGGRCLFLAMRLIGGGSLREFLQRRGSLSPRQALYLLQQAAAGLDEAHRRGIIHRDIKPANLLLEPGAPGDPGPRLYLADFGIAKRSERDDDVKTRTGSFIGTPEYMAPEQLQGGTASARSDIYALTIVLYEMLTGKSPYSGTTPAMVIYRKLTEPTPAFDARTRGLPPAIDAVLARGMAQQPEVRFASAGDLVTAFAAALRNEAMTASEPLPRSDEMPTVVAPPRPAAPAPVAQPVRRSPPPERAQAAPRIDAYAPTINDDAYEPRRDDEYGQHRQAARRYGVGGVVWALVALLVFALVAGFLIARAVLRDTGGGGGIGRVPTAISGVGVATAFPTPPSVEPTAEAIEPTVEAAEPTLEPTPAPDQPSPAPDQPTPAPVEPTVTDTAVVPTVEPSATPTTERPFPQAGIDQAIGAAGGTFGLIIFDAARGGDLYRTNDSQVFPAASLIKLPIVLGTYDLARQGQIDLDERLTLQDSDKVGGSGRIQNDPAGTTYSIRELCSLMLRFSDNTAGNMVLRKVGGFDTINAIMQRLGAPNTQVKRFFLDEAAQQQGIENTTTPTEMLLLLQKLQNGELANPADTQQIMASMGQNDDLSKLPAQLPAAITVYHKTGTLPSTSPSTAVEHDVGIIELPDGRRYFVIAMSVGASSNQAAIDAIANISELIYDFEQ